jgi:hypothetical protein
LEKELQTSDLGVKQIAKRRRSEAEKNCGISKGWLDARIAEAWSFD